MLQCFNEINMITDPISDMLTRIRNALRAKKTEVRLPFSKIKMAIAQILEKEEYVLKAEKEANSLGEIRIELKYLNSEAAISSLKRVSKPGQRIYVNKDNLPKVRNNMGMAIISTSQGLMTNKEAKKKRLGGEVLCEIY